jgi:hypothetical protein
MDAASVVWSVIGLLVLFLVVAPLLVVLAHRVLSRIAEVRRYAEDVLEHGVGIAANLDPVPALIDTRDLVKEAGGGLLRYGAAVEKLLAGRAS